MPSSFFRFGAARMHMTALGSRSGGKIFPHTICFF
jgi:hypothetical protein